MVTSSNAVLAPVSGFIEHVSTAQKFDDDDTSVYYTVLYIYIASNSKHNIYAPVTGELMSPTASAGAVFTKTGLFQQQRTAVVTDPLHPQSIEAMHTATLTWRLAVSGNVAPLILRVHVGKPQYITDTVRLAHPDQIANKRHVFAGELLGEIVLGSRAELWLPVDDYSHKGAVVRVAVHPSDSVAKLEALQRQRGDDFVGGVDKIVW